MYTHYVWYLSAVSSTFLSAIIVPVYKGKGKNPLLTTNYQGISLTWAHKEWALCWRKKRYLTICRQHFNLVILVLVVQEAIRGYIQEKSLAFQCFKAFDSVEYCVLLHHLYRSGINGKAWRNIRSLYADPQAQVRIGLSHVIKFQHGSGRALCCRPCFFC